MNDIVERCPDCCEQVGNRGWNVLHFAIKGWNPSWCLKIIMEIIKEKRSPSYLLNEENAKGDTSLHFYSKNTSLQLPKSFINDPRLDKNAFIKQNLNVREIASTVRHLSYKQLLELKDEIGMFIPQRVIPYEDDAPKLEDKQKEKEEKEKEEKRSTLQKTTEVHLVVAALIATVTFAACITMPGGFVSGGEDSHPGSVILRRKAAFKVFVITDTISMVLSSSAVFIHLLTPFLSISDIDDKRGPMKLVYLAFKFILWAMIAMGLAFVTGTYAVLMPSLDLAIANCIIGLTFFAIIFSVLGQLLDFSFSEIFDLLCIWKLD